MHTMIDQLFEYHTEAVSIDDAYQIYIHLILRISSNACKRPKRFMTQPSPVPARASVYGDGKPKLPPSIAQDLKKEICEPYENYSSCWYAYDTFTDHSGLLDAETVSVMQLNFVPRVDEPHRTIFSGSGSDSRGNFVIIDGLWDADGLVAFQRQHLTRPNDHFGYQGRMLPFGVCGFYGRPGH